MPARNSILRPEVVVSAVSRAWAVSEHIGKRRTPKRKEGQREREERKKRSAFFRASCFGHKIIVFFSGEKTHTRLASSRSQRVSRVVVVVVVVLLRVNVLMQKLNIRESCERKQD